MSDGFCASRSPRPSSSCPPRADDARSAGPAAPKVVAIDMAAGWCGRDWQRCRSDADHVCRRRRHRVREPLPVGAVWQVPTPNGPFEIDPTRDWVRACERPPISFFRRLAADRGTAMLADVSEFPHLAWRWRVQGAIDDTEIAQPDGRIRGRRDDFAAKLGVIIQARGGSDVRLAYVGHARAARDGALPGHTISRCAQSACRPASWSRRARVWEREAR